MHVLDDLTYLSTKLKEKKPHLVFEYIWYVVLFSNADRVLFKFVT